MLTNVLTKEIDWTAFGNAYQVFRIRGNDLNFYSDILNMDPEKDGNVSVVYRKENNRPVCYAMMRRSPTAFAVLKEACLRHDGDYAIEEKDPAAIPEEYFLQLLVNSAHNMPYGKYAWANLDGTLYVRTDIQSDAACSGSDVPGVIVCLKIETAKSGLGTALNANVATFTHQSMFKSDEQKKMFWQTFPKYVFRANVVHRAPSGTDGPLYVKKNPSDQRHNVTELSFRSEFDLMESKQGVLLDIVKRVNILYDGLISLSFSELEPAFMPVLDTTIKVYEAHKGTLHGRVPSVWLEGDLEDEEVMGTIVRLKESLLSDYGYDEKAIQVADWRTEAPEGTIRLRCIHDKAWYGKRQLEDPHTRRPKYVQHFTVENTPKTAKNLKRITACLLTELVIMQDIRDGKCSFFDMPDTWTVYKQCKIKRKDKSVIKWYNALTIKQDGTIECQTYDEDDELVFDVSEAFEEYRVEYVFRHEDGCIYPLWLTPVRSMADPGPLKERIQEVEHAETTLVPAFTKDKDGNKIPKIDIYGKPVMKERRRPGGGWSAYDVLTTYLRGFVEIGTFSKDNDLYYFCGHRPKGFNGKLMQIRNGVVFRRIADGMEKQEQFLDLLKTCVCEFIRAGQLSVYPAIIKYMTLYTAHFAEIPPQAEETI